MSSISRLQRPLETSNAMSRPLSDEPDIVGMARASRRSAQRFAEAVRRYSAEMPEALERFHDAMGDFRQTARCLREGRPVNRMGAR